MAKVYQDTRPRAHGGIRPWCISYVGFDGKRHRERTSATTKTEALAILRQKMAEVARARIAGVNSLDAVRPITFEEFVRSEYMPHCEATHTAATYVRDRSLCTAVLPFFGRMQLRSIRSGDLQRYVDQRVRARSKLRKEPLTPATANREVSFVSGVLTEAIRRGYLDRNVAKGVAKLPEHNDVLRWITDQEEARLLEFAPEFLRPIIRVALLTGMRYGEVLSRTWADYDFEQCLVRVTGTKSHKTRYVPMNDDLVELVRSISPIVGRDGPNPYVFGNPFTGKAYRDVSHAFKRTCERAGLQDVTFHTLRHTFASRLAQAGVPLNTIRELLGHGSMQMTMRYAHLAPNNLRDAVALLTKSKKPRGNGTSTVHVHPAVRSKPQALGDK